MSSKCFKSSANIVMMKTYLIEEWASRSDQRFRLDSLEQLDSGRRKSLLSYGETNEIFHFEPFRCGLVEPDLLDSVLPRSLSGLFPRATKSSSDSFVVSGIGSLWLYMAEKPKIFKASSNSKYKNSRKPLKSFYPVTVTASDKFRQDVTFYFIDYDIATSLVAIEIGRDLLDDTKRKVLAFMHIKSFDVPSYEAKDITSSRPSEVFRLPTGYGCKRGPYFAKKTPLDLSGKGMMNKLLRLDLVVLEPVENDHDLEKWKSRTVSVKLLYGRLKTKRSKSDNGDYMVMEQQRFESTDGAQSMRMERKRRVWELGDKGLDKIGTTDLVRQYFINERTGECEATFESDTNDVSVFFSRYNSKSKIEGINLNKKFLDFVLGATENYHLLYEEVDEDGAETQVFEVEISVEKMIDLRLSLFWSQHLSIVRRQVRPKNINPKYDVTDTTITIHLFDDSEETQVAQVHMKLVELKPLALTSIHKALDVTPCLRDFHHEPLEFSLDYSLQMSSTDDKILEKKGSSMLKELDTRQGRDIIYGLFLLSLLQNAPIDLNPIQVAKIEIEEPVVEEMKLRISAQLWDRPLELDFVRERDVAIDSRKHSGVFSSTVSNSLRCAHSCVHFDCKAYSFCHERGACQILVEDWSKKESEGGRGSVETKIDPHCDLYRRISGRLHASAHQFAHEIMSSVQAGPDKGWMKPLLLLRKEVLSDRIVNISLELTPVSFQAQGESLNLIEQETDLDEADLDESSTSSRGARAPYTVVASVARYESPTQLDEEKFPYQTARDFSYDECESLCGQVDCGSFSYCNLDKTCTVSRLHQTNEIKKHLVEGAAFCQVLSRNYWTKFDQVPVDRSASKKIEDMVDVVRVEKMFERDCANVCVEPGFELKSDFKCRSFHFCKKRDPDQLSECLLSSKRFTSKEAAPLITLSNPEASFPCSTYTRSYLLEFDRFFKKALASELVQGSEIVLMERDDASAERCAALCAESDNRCTAFTVCKPSSGGPALTCTRAPSSVRVKPSSLEVNERCSSFILRPGATLNDQRVVEDELEPNQEASSSEQHTEEPGSFNWLTKLALLLVGLLTGYVAAVLVQSRRSA